MNIIIYENLDLTVAVLAPSITGVSFGMINLGKKDTPTGLPFWIVDSSVLPSDRKDRDSWRLDGTQGTPDGYGD